MSEKEPADRAVVLDFDGWAWQRSGNVWMATTTLLAPHDWAGLLADRGPLSFLTTLQTAPQHHIGSWAITQGECCCECPRCWRDQCICPECEARDDHDH